MKRIFLFSSLLVLLVAVPALATEISSTDLAMAEPGGNVVPATTPLEAGGDGLAGGGSGRGAAVASGPQGVDTSAPDLAQVAETALAPAPHRTPMARSVLATQEEAAPKDLGAVAPTQPAFMSEDKPFKLRDYEEPKPTAQAPFWQQALGFVLKLALVIGLIFCSLGAIKKLSGGRVSLPTSKGRNMVVLETTHLGPQQAVHLISLGGERLLVVGASPAGITKLAELTDPAQVRPFLKANSGGASSPFNQVYDLESAGVEHQQDLFAETMREVGDRYGARRTEWPK